jgi:hypothetical protein
MHLAEPVIGNLRPLTAEQTVYPEEIGHVAAGVRWLTHLHAHASKTAHLSQSGCNSTASPPTPSTSTTTDVNTKQELPAAASGFDAVDLGHLQASIAGLVVQDKMTECKEAFPEDSNWAAEARQFPTVQLWFHR